MCVDVEGSLWFFCNWKTPWNYSWREGKKSIFTRIEPQCGATLSREHPITLGLLPNDPDNVVCLLIFHLLRGCINDHVWIISHNCQLTVTLASYRISFFLTKFIFVLWTYHRIPWKAAINQVIQLFSVKLQHKAFLVSFFCAVQVEPVLCIKIQWLIGFHSTHSVLTHMLSVLSSLSMLNYYYIN